jgi:hypothetical protein
VNSNKPPRVTLHIKITPDVLSRFKTQARSERRRMCDVLEEALRLYIIGSKDTEPPACARAAAGT